ncbi:hypothetical protein [Microbulbifer aggregans]|uniref:hypothetical protein n=1 Tax=Microbulbifer aggregans TaxID=1769779 RepID=UPI001CFE14EE|nr:hypothetical protein [Microbulbifer aggregans]
MSGRKKNRKHQRGQPPSELLNELSSLRELLGSDQEADIPLLDQVAEPGSAPVNPTPARPAAIQRPLEEADLPILFSPIDEEPVEDYSFELSDADRELLRPLQALPRGDEHAAAGAPQPESIAAEAPRAEAAKPAEKYVQPETAKPAAREEFQPGLFDGPKKPAAESKRVEPKAIEAEPAKPAPAVIATGENPFLPPHIRARLTGGRIPRTEEKEGTTTQEVQPETPEHQSQAAPESTEAPKLSNRELLIEQLVAEQLHELERQLRANITAMVDEIYFKKS